MKALNPIPTKALAVEGVGGTESEMSEWEWEALSI